MASASPVSDASASSRRMLGEQVEGVPAAAWLAASLLACGRALTQSSAHEPTSFGERGGEVGVSARARSH